MTNTTPSLDELVRDLTSVGKFPMAKSEVRRRISDLLVEERERIKRELDTMSFTPDQFNSQLTDKGKAQLEGWSKHYDAVLASLTHNI